MKLSELLVDVAKEAIKTQANDGSFPAGHNGLYHDQETPLRNTGHWLITLIKAYEISKNGDFKQSAEKALNYIMDKKQRPMGATFFSRMNPKKDFCNGLIGQAWAIEALVAGAEFFKSSEALELAQEIFLLHPFNKKLSLWHRVNVDGSHTSLDMTFNHQLWFAATGSMLIDDKVPQIKQQVLNFLDKAENSYFRIDPSGLIKHDIYKKDLKSTLIRYLRTALSPQNYLQQKKSMIIKENGYHAFNLYGFALLYNATSEHAFWQSKKFNQALQYTQKDLFVSQLNNNIFGYPYNIAGFEVAFAMQKFKIKNNNERNLEWWINKQVEETYDKNKKQFSLNNEDTSTLTARLYEATRIKEPD